MKILLVTPSLRSGGAERQLFELACCLMRSDFSIAVITLSSDSDVYSEKLRTLGCECRTLGHSGRGAQLKEMVSISKQLAPDIIHGFQNIGCVFALAASIVNRIPLISSAIRDAKNQTWKYELSYLLLARFSKYFVSNSRAGFNCRYTSWRNNFRVIYNGMNFDRFDVENQTVIRELFEDRKIKIVMVASLSLHKDHKTLFSALGSPRLKDFDIELSLIGDEPPSEQGNKERLIALLSELGISERVKFCGYRSDVESLIAASDISILLTNSRIHLEGLSNTVAESMALSKPVIATDSGGTPELIENNVTGLLVPDGDVDAVTEAVLALISNPDKAKELGSRARAFILSSLNVDRMTQEYVSLYNSALSNTQLQALNKK